MSYTVSIAMALYNGEKYLREQLESIHNQTILPSELIACDDGSTDACNELFAKFVTENSLEDKWKLKKMKRTWAM